MKMVDEQEYDRLQDDVKRFRELIDRLSQAITDYKELVDPLVEKFPCMEGMAEIHGQYAAIVFLLDELREATK